MKKISVEIFAILLFVMSLNLIGAAQPVRPVYTSTSLDGQLMGLQTGDLTLGGLWKPDIAFAIPTDFSFRTIRFRLGLGVNTGYTFPVIDQRLGNYSLSYIDWFSSPILGREGQRGLESGFDFGETHYTGFLGDLWPSDTGESFTPVAFFGSDASHSIDLPYGWTLSASSESVMGLVLPPGTSGLSQSFNALLEALKAQQSENTFRSADYTLSLSLEGFRLSGQFGMLQNQAHLKGFEFVSGVRGISQSLHGNQYWNFTIERIFTMYQTSFPLNLPAQFQAFPFIPQAIPVKLEGRLFFQGGSATHEVEPPPPCGRQGSTDARLLCGPRASDDEPKTALQTDRLFSWGISTTLYVYTINVRAEMIFTQDGETKFNFNFSY
jgi:hypothetical protein